MKIINNSFFFKLGNKNKNIVLKNISNTKLAGILF